MALAFGFMLTYLTADLMPVNTRAWIILTILIFAVTLALILVIITKPSGQIILCRGKNDDAIEGNPSSSNSASTSTSNNPPVYGSALFEACGSIVLSEITISWVNRITVSSPDATTLSSESDLSAIPESFLMGLPSDAYCERYQPRPPSPAYSHKSEMYERQTSVQSAITPYSSEPVFSQTLSTLTATFISNIIHANHPSQACEAESSTDNSIFEPVEANACVTNMSSIIMQRTLSDVSTNSAFEEIESEGVMDLTASLLDTPSNEGNTKQSQPKLNSCDSIDGSRPAPNVHSLSHCLRTPTVNQTDPNTSVQRRASSAPSRTRSYEEPMDTNRGEPSTSGTRSDTRSDVIYIGSPHNSDTEDSSIWTSISISRYSV